MGLNGIELIQDCSIELTIGRRYGLIGQNGCGKTNFLQCLANREVGVARTISPMSVTRGTCVLTLLPFIMRWYQGWWAVRLAECAQHRHIHNETVSAALLGGPACADQLDYATALQQVPIPDHMDLYHLSEEVEPTPRTALETVVDYIKNEIDRLNKLEEHILETVGPEDERLQVSSNRVSGYFSTRM